MNQQEFGRKLLVDIKYPYFPHSIGAIVKGDNLNYDFIFNCKSRQISCSTCWK